VCPGHIASVENPEADSAMKQFALPVKYRKKPA